MIVFVMWPSYGTIEGVRVNRIAIDFRFETFVDASNAKCTSSGASKALDCAYAKNKCNLPLGTSIHYSPITLRSHPTFTHS